MEPSIIALLTGIGLAALVALVVALILGSKRRERERAEALQRLAETSGWTYEPEANVDALRAEADLPLFGRGRAKRAKSVMRSRRGDLDMVVFDYQFTTGAGKEQHTERETVVMFPGANRSLPDLRMFPENVLTRFAEKFGYKDIDIESSPEFSRNYVVKGTDEPGIRTALYPNATMYFGEHAGWTVEVRGAAVALYRSGRRATAEEMPILVEDARAALRALTSS